MSIKRLAPEAIEIFSVVLHPKRRYTARATYLVNSSDVPIDVPINALTTEDSEALLTEDSEYLITES